MKKTLNSLAILILGIGFIACNGKAESASSIAQKWCELNGIAHKAAEGTEKEAAKEKLHNYEKEIETKHKDDKTFMDEVKKKVEKCEDASEGR